MHFIKIMTVYKLKMTKNDHLLLSSVETVFVNKQCRSRSGFSCAPVGSGSTLYANDKHTFVDVIVLLAF